MAGLMPVHKRNELPHSLVYLISTSSISFKDALQKHLYIIYIHILQFMSPHNLSLSLLYTSNYFQNIWKIHYIKQSG